MFGNQNPQTGEPDGAMAGQIDSVSALLLSLDPVRLQHTLQTLAGKPASSLVPSFKIDLQTINELQKGCVNLKEIYSHMGGLMDALSGNPRLLDKTGIEELLYRLTVMLMRPDIFFWGDESSKAPLSAGTFDKLCQLILSNLDKRFTMSELEMISGCSSRTLQYQFKSKLGCSPMRWMAQKRLEASRSRLLQAKPGDTVTLVAFLFGFTNLGNFSRMYAHYFGELPSETLQMTQKARS